MSRDHTYRAEGSLLVLVLLIVAAGLLLAFLARTREGVPADAINLNTASRDDLAVALEMDPTLADTVTDWRRRHGGFSQVRDIVSVPAITDPATIARVRAALTQGHLDVNRVDARALRRTLGIPAPVAQRIVDRRATLTGGAFRSPLDILRSPAAGGVGAVDDRSLAALGSRAIVRGPAQVFWQFAVMALLLLIAFAVVPVALRAARRGGDPFMVPIALLLAGLGVIELFSISDPYRDPAYYSHHVIGVLYGLAALLAGALLKVDPRRALRRYTYVWALAAIVLLGALFLFGFGPEHVRLSLAFFQPVEIVKLLLALFMAGYLTQRGDLIADALRHWRPPLPRGLGARYRGIALPRWSDVGPICGMFGVALVLFLIVRDMGPALLLFGAFLCTLYLATGRAGIVWLGLLLAIVGGFLGYALHVGVLPVRVQMWLSPWDNRLPNGMQLGQALWGLASGGWSGTGLGLGSPGSMAAVKNDLIYAAVGEELGLVGAVGVLFLFAVLVWRGLRTALRTHNDFDRLLAVGLTSILACQVFLIVAGVTGLLPLTGITLPFVSYGNSSLVASFLMLGLLRGISAPTGSVPVGAPRPILEAATRRFALAVAIGLLGLLGVGRVLWVQTVAADRVAGRSLYARDRDGFVRPKVNPRLLAIARAIERGTIYDRRNRVLATSRLSEMSKELQDEPGRARRLFVAHQRYYPRGAACAHIVGYLDPAIGGPIGLERDFDADLRGFRDYGDLLRDYRAKDLPGYQQRKGKDLVTTLDANLQETALHILKQRAGAMRDGRSGRAKDRAAMVALDPATGDVLVSVSIPTFDPNTLTPARWREMQANADASHRMVDRARAGLYPPGSTLKVATAGTGLEDGESPTYDCNHVAFDLKWRFRGQVYGRRQLQDDKGEEPHNVIGMARALRVSCNLYFANLGLVLGPERLYHGFADPDRWALRNLQPLPVFARDLPVNAFGQGTMLVTPTEMARVASAVANKGSMMQPGIWREVREPGGGVLRRNSPAEMSRPLGTANAARLADMMRGVVTDGTAHGVFEGLPVQVAGKTGTAQTDEGDRQPHSWFIGYAPFSRPEIAFACLIENGGYGKRVSAPACRDLLEEKYGH